MRPDLHSEITRRLIADYGLKGHGNWLQKGKCPECGRKELYTHADEPWTLWCGRENKCGHEIRVKDIYKDLFESWSDRYIATEEQPNAAADAYLQFNRGFPLARLQGLYTQQLYHDRELNQSSATVRFEIPGGSWWERIIDRPERFAPRKANFAFGAKYQGRWWQMPDSPATPAELWLVEGIFKAIALELHGIAARSLMTSGNYPDIALQELADACRAAGVDRPRLVIALDNDKTGHRYTLEFVERARRDGWVVDAAQPPVGRGGEKLDWDELHVRGRLSPTHIAEYRYLGALLIAPTPRARGRLIYKHTRRRAFHFDFGSRLYWFAYDADKGEKARRGDGRDDGEDADTDDGDDAETQAMTVTQIANVLPQPVYFMRNELTDEAWYMFSITSPDLRMPVNCTFTAVQLGSPPEFRRRLIHSIPGADFFGSSAQLGAFYRETTGGIRVVETIDYVGYSAEHDTYVFTEHAVSKGAIYQVNEHGYFEIGKLAIKALTGNGKSAVRLRLNGALSEFDASWIGNVWHCYGPNGLIALSFWFGSLFAEQIRARHGMYPFFEMSGPAGAGKTTLVELLWKLIGRPGNAAIDPTKSTPAGRARTFMQVSNIPIVLTEADRDKGEKNQAPPYDYDELKPLLNGNFGRATGMKTSTNDTYDPPFRASIMIEQNRMVTGSDALMERIVRAVFDHSRFTPENRDRANLIKRVTMKSASGFALLAASKADQVLEMFDATFPLYVDGFIKGGINNYRIAETHSMFMALVDCLRMVIPFGADLVEETHAQLRAMASQRIAVLQDDPPIVKQFWDIYNELEGMPIGPQGDGEPERLILNHSANPDVIAINLVEFESIVTARRLRMPADAMTLKNELRKSRRYPLIGENHKVHSRKTSKTKSCWTFSTTPARK